MFESLFRGLAQASRQWKMILLLLVTNVLLAAPLAVPVFVLVRKTSSGTRAAQRMFADKIDVIWLTDLINWRFEGFSASSVRSQIQLLLLVMGAIYLLTSVFFSGGILQVLNTENQRFTMRRFWEGCGAYFGRFFRLTLISLFFYGGALAIYKVLEISLSLTDARASAEKPGIIKDWLAIGALLAVFAFVNMVVDYAKISTVLNDSRQMIRNFASAAQFSLKRLPQAFGLYVLIALSGTVIFLILLWIRSLIPQASYLTVFAAVLIGQLAIASKMWMRVAFYAGETGFYRIYARQPALPPQIDKPITTVPKQSTTAFNEPEAREEALPAEPVSSPGEIVSATPVLYDLEAEIEAMRRADLEASRTAVEPEQKTSGQE